MSDRITIDLSAKLEPEVLARLKMVNEAMKQLEGVYIPFNIIRNVIDPFTKWLEGSIAEGRCLSVVSDGVHSEW